MLEYSWIIPVLPLAAFLVILLFTRENRSLSAALSITAIAIGFVYATLLLFRQIGDNTIFEMKYGWIVFPTIEIQIGILVDSLTTVMLMVVTIVSLLVQIYSIGYMHGDPRYSRFFSYLSLFTFAMLGLVMANNYFMLLIFWELVGLTSYLLIGFWFEKKTASDAGKKAFITTRIGDFGFGIGICMLGLYFGTFNYLDVFHMAEHSVVPAGILTLTGILLFCGAIGKSAQFPLHVWLPDAMEGPTPVSALIHAATMVAAGVYMVARSMAIFASSPDAAVVVAWIGIITALLAATIALTQNDIKRILAYSTVSQLGYMIMALGLGSFTAGTLHLMTHGFFKASLFLCAGSVIHAIHTNDIQFMGGLRRKTPITFWSMLIASLSIAGIFPLSGFWSKDEIIAATAGHPVFKVLTLLVAFMTAFYMFRLIFLTFFGEPRDRKAYDHAHESPKTMTTPLIILSVLSICAGWVAIPWLHKGYSMFAYYHEPHHAHAHWDVMITSTIVAGAGILLAWLVYQKKLISADMIARKFKRLYTLSFRKFYFDEIYDAIIIKPILGFADYLWGFDNGLIDGIVNGLASFTLWLSRVKLWFDLHIIDGIVNGLGYSIWGIGAIIRQFQTGRVQFYGVIIMVGIVLMLVIRIV
ncbi:MAG: NADH-quinone oxidoreductase subunit L [candidate division Zixibacteria bacterium]|nr:NADH-quinone oxidoreductase subunit L [candidate division Zixibacteria bacterium]